MEDAWWEQPNSTQAKKRPFFPLKAGNEATDTAAHVCLLVVD